MIVQGYLLIHLVTTLGRVVLCLSIPNRYWGSGCMGVRLNSLLEGSHLLYLEKLPPPLCIDQLPLVPFNLELLCELLFLLLEVFHLLLELFNLLILSLHVCLVTILQAIDCLEKPIWIFDLVLDQGPKLLEQSTQVL